MEQTEMMKLPPEIRRLTASPELPFGTLARFLDPSPPNRENVPGDRLFLDPNPTVRDAAGSRCVAHMRLAAPILIPPVWTVIQIWSIRVLMWLMLLSYLLFDRSMIM